MCQERQRYRESSVATSQEDLSKPNTFEKNACKTNIIQVGEAQKKLHKENV